MSVNLTSSAIIDGTPGDPVTITAGFTCDAQDPQATVSVNGRKGSAAITVTNPDPATMLITITI
jgi:hypothetical protein